MEIEKGKTYDASDEPAVREILDCLQRLKDQDAPTEQASDVLRISVQVHNLIRQREEARLVALTLAAAFVTACALASLDEEVEPSDDVPPTVQQIIDDLVKKHREHGRDKSAPYWPKGDA
jgi:hypothetical protein